MHSKWNELQLLYLNAQQKSHEFGLERVQISGACITTREDINHILKAWCTPVPCVLSRPLHQWCCTQWASNAPSRFANNALLGVRVGIREWRKIKRRSKALLSFRCQSWTSLVVFYSKVKCPIAQATTWSLDYREGLENWEQPSYYCKLTVKHRILMLQYWPKWWGVWSYMTTHQYQYICSILYVAYVS